MFEVGKIYHRQSEIHEKFGGNPQSGISPCRMHPYIFLFTSPVGRMHGYKDGWVSSTEYEYTGEGQYGNMELIRGNLAIRNHQTSGRHLLLFKKVSSGNYQYIGEFRYKSYKDVEGIDTGNEKRYMIVFRLEKVK